MIYTILIIPLLQIITGYLMYKYPPKKVNLFIGYRTKKSMKNQKNWDFANKYCGMLWLKIGASVLIITLLLSFLFYLKIIIFTENIITIIIIIEIIIMILSGLLPENKLKNYK